MTAIAMSEARLDSDQEGHDFRGSDPELEAALVAHAHGLMSRALFLTRDPACAADLYQDTVERALSRRHRRRDSVRLGSWLMTIMQNLFIDQYRAGRAWKFVGNAETVLAKLAEGPSEPESLWRKVDDELLDAAINRLPARFRPLYVMHAAGSSYAEIARELGIPPNTVATRLFRLRRRLRHELVAALQAEASAGGKVVPFERREESMPAAAR